MLARLTNPVALGDHLTTGVEEKSSTNSTYICRASSLDQMRARGGRIEPFGEILRFTGHQPVAEFHDAYRVGGHAVIGQHEFSDPEIAAAGNSPDRESLRVGLDEPALLNVATAADPLARLRIIKHGILAVDVMFGLEIAGVRSIPMALKRRPHGSVFHFGLLPALAVVRRVMLRSMLESRLFGCYFRPVRAELTRYSPD